jgi:Protein of unknown function (DUF3237)
MKLEPLYRAEFTYPEAWAVDLGGAAGTEGQHFFVAEGRCRGRISGRLRGANHPRRRTDQTFVPDFQGVIEADDGATVFFDYRGYGRAYPEGRRQIVGSATHLADDERYRWLNDVVCVCTGEVRMRPDKSGADLVLDVAELVWEPMAD